MTRLRAIKKHSSIAKTTDRSCIRQELRRGRECSTAKEERQKEERQEEELGRGSKRDRNQGVLQVLEEIYQ